MDPAAAQLNADDYSHFIPAALDAFQLRPTKTNLTGRKMGNGFKFIYTLEWYQEGGIDPTPSRSRSVPTLSEKSRVSRSSSASGRSTFGGLTGIIDESDGPIPMPIRIEEVDGKHYHIVDDENCQLQMEDNYEFNQLMRDEAIRQGLYYPTSFTPLRNGKVTELDRERKSKDAIVIREKYFDEWMKFREEGALYTGLWKGLIVPKSGESTLSSASHPEVDLLNEPDWLEKRKERKEKDAARKQWLAERKKEMDGLECLKQQRGSLSSSASTPRKTMENFVHLEIHLPDNIEVELLHRASRQDEVKSFLAKMVEESHVPEMPPISDIIDRLFYKTANGSKRRLHLEEELCLDDVEMADYFWRFSVDCRK